MLQIKYNTVQKILQIRLQYNKNKIKYYYKNVHIKVKKMVMNFSAQLQNSN